jgi:hypothetical protein
MNQTNYLKSRTRLYRQTIDCTMGFHSWLDADPITGRRYCRDCLAYVTSHVIDEVPHEIVWSNGCQYDLGWHDIDHPEFRDGWPKARKGK